MAAQKDKLRVVLISDKSTDREGLKILQKQGKFKVVREVKSVNEAIKFIDKDSPDFIVIENGPPSKNIDAINRLKGTNPDVPIVIMSSHAEEVHIAGTLRAGASGYIIKQNIAQELTDAVLKI